MGERCQFEGYEYYEEEEEFLARCNDKQVIRVFRTIRVLCGLCSLFPRPPLLFFTGSCDNTVRIWDVASQQQVAQLTGHTDWVTSVAFDGSGKYLASGEMTQAWSVLRHIFPPFSWMLSLWFAACWMLILMWVMMRTVWRQRRWCGCLWCGCFAWDVIVGWLFLSEWLGVFWIWFHVHLFGCC